MNFHSQIAIETKKEKLKKLNSKIQMERLLYEWVKTNNINVNEFITLADWISEQTFNNPS